MIEQIITSSVLIIAICLIRLIFEKRISSCTRYMLWLLVVVKLLVPMPHLETGTNVMNVAHKLEDNAVNFRFVDEEDENAAFYGTDLPTADIRIEKNEDQNIWNEYPIKELFFIVWLVGAAGVFLAILFANIKFSIRIVKKRKYVNEYQKLKVFKTSAEISPCLYGIIKPAIYINDKLKFSREKMNYILLHEYMHYRHGDHIWAMFRCMCIILYWYHPFVWLAASLSMKDSEFACDESTVKYIGETSRIEYGKTLLETLEMMEQNFDKTKFLICSPSIAGGVKDMKKRMIKIARKTKINKVAVLLTLILSIVLAGCTLGTAKDDEKTLEENSETGSLEQEQPLSDENTEQQFDVEAADEQTGSIDSQNVVLYDMPKENMVCIRVEPSTLRERLSYYYIPEGEEQNKLQELINGLDMKWQPSEGRWQGRKEIGWTIVYNDAEYRAFEGDYLFRFGSNADQTDVEYFEKNEEICSLVNSMMNEIGYTPVDITQIKNIVSARLEITGHRTGNERKEFIITDPEVLAKFEDWFSNAKYIPFGAYCSNEWACLQLTLADGTTVNLSPATDSCTNFGVNGVYYDYRPKEYYNEDNGWYSDELFSIIDQSLVDN